MAFNINEHQHIRYNPLKGEWVLVSPHRTLRPWSGQVEPSTGNKIPPFDPTNPLCPGVKRSSGITTPNYTSTYVFTNDFPALLEEGPEPTPSDDPLFQIATAKGTCRVICFHPRSDVYIPTMTLEEVRSIIEEWIRQMKELGPKFLWVQIFENRGAMMGCSNPHPHCQVWASNFLPNEPSIKDKHLREYYEKYKKPLLQDYAEKEQQKGERVVCENEEWLVVVPYWAIWPFETMVLPKRQIQRFTDTDESQRENLAKILQQLITKYDNVFKCSFPYSMGWHGAPTGPKLNENQPHWTFHGIYYPPLLRSATIKKFMVGYELLAQSQRDLSPESAAAVLRRQSDVYYTKQ
ncbi:probable galactose-1-phosphate uridylyltransferase [Agrilus planipennis]|uniref:Galactose-1-phosphate uridylyltransferase n=1 Tax=Agrilus planipennis TaxID=224129 RepID=A0A1W4X7F2_AGRPL|nr:probable galactose-1-phosphate uridylyltransferase [Agrilus planipennis]